jgi:hypothetical protein
MSFELTGLRSKAPVVFVLVEDLAPRSPRRPRRRSRRSAAAASARPAHDVDADALVLVRGIQLGQDERRTSPGHAASRPDAFLDGRPGRVRDFRRYEPEIGQMIAEAMQKVGNEGVITCCGSAKRRR